MALHLAREASDQTNHGRLKECIREQAHSYWPTARSEFSSVSPPLGTLASIKYDVLPFLNYF